MKKIYITADEIENPVCDRESQETAINWMRGDNIIQIFTTDLTTVTKLKNIMKRCPEGYRCFYYSDNLDKATNKPRAYTFECKRNLLSFRADAVKQGPSDEQVEAFVERMKYSRNKNS